jgi:hypothetical protein
MASKVYKDLIGSTQTNTETSFGSEAERRVFVRIDQSESSPNNTLLGKAIAKAVGTDYYHPDDPSLPLQRARAVQIGKDTAEVILEYKRISTSSGPLDVPTSGGVVYNSRARMGTRRIYKDLVSGYWFDTESRSTSDPTKAIEHSKPPKPRSIPSPEETITVPAVLNVAQFSQLQAAKNDIGKTNSNALKFAGHTFPAGTMLLAGIDTDWQSQQVLGGQTANISWGGNTTGVNAAIIFIVQYNFVYRPQGWAEQVAYWSAGTEEWLVNDYASYESTSMTGYPL